MIDWLDLSLQLHGHGVSLLLLPLVCGFAYYVYRRTLPPVDRFLRAVLVTARCLVLVLLLLVLAQPTLALWSKKVVRPRVLVLVDTSPSMATSESGAQRMVRVREVLESDGFQRALAPASATWWGFADEPYPISVDTLGTVTTRGPATDLAAALRQSLDRIPDRKSLDAVLVFSDGAHNLGQDPVRVGRDLGVPIYALGVGTAENPADIRIVKATASETAYRGHGVRIQAEVRGAGYAGRELDLLLYEGAEEIDRQRLSLPPDAQGQRVSFQVHPAATGPHIYRLRVPPQEGEFSRDNNEALVFTRVLENRIQVLLAAGAPSPDLAFLQRALQADSSFVVETAVRRKDGRFYRPAAVSGDGDSPAASVSAGGLGAPAISSQLLTGKGRKDVVVLLHPGPALLAGEAGRAFARHLEAGGGLLLVGGARTFRDPNAPVAAALPLETSGPRFVVADTYLRLAADGRHHPVVRVQQEQGATTADPWGQLPPLPGYLAGVRPRPGSMVLLEGLDDPRPPVIVAGSAGEGKVLAALSAAFWRLDLLSSGVGGRPETIREFWRNAVKWLALKTPAGRVRVSTERHIYRAGEQVLFAAQVFDELLRPQNAATVRIALGEEGLEFQLQDQGDGQYQGAWTGLPPDDYRYVATAFVGDTSIGTDEGSFTVEQHTIESVDVRADKALLSDMARGSGGRYRDLEEWGDLLELLPLQKRLVENRSVFSLWGESWLLVVVLLLLAAEWILRKRGGML